MKKLFAAALLVALITVAGSPVLAKSHRFNLITDASINGIALEKGRYELKMEDGSDVAEIYHDGELVVKARVAVEPLEGALPKSVALGQDGKVMEVRLKKERIVFLDGQIGVASGN